MMGNYADPGLGLNKKDGALAKLYLSRFLETYKGIKWSSRFPCANALTKNACRRELHGSCQIPHADHTDVWIKHRKAVLITTQPYNVEIDDLRDIIKYCDEWGLEFLISATSWHYPGWTKLLVFWAKGTNPWEISES